MNSFRTKTARCFVERISYITLLLCCFFIPRNTLHATVYTVNNFTDGNALNQLRGAIANASLTAGPHTINLSTGTYLLSAALGAITIDGATNITINGNGPTLTTIDGNNSDRIFFINTTGTNPNIVIAVNGVKFTKGKLDLDPFGGGAIRAGGPGNVLNLNNCDFTNNGFTVNGGTTGGAINISGGGTVSITNCTFTSNSNNNSDGGAVYFFLGASSGVPGSFTVTDCVFTSNTAVGSGGALGIASGGGNTFTCNILRNKFIGNSSTGGNGGGAIVINNGSAVGNTATIKYNSFLSNTATAANALRTAVAVQISQGNVDLTNNWWGCNGGDSTNSCADNAARVGPGGGVYNLTPFLQLKTVATTNAICGGSPFNTTAITSGFTSNSAGQAIAAANLTVLVGKSISFSSVLGAISGAQTSIQANGNATATFTSNGTAGWGTINAVVDNVPLSDTTARDSVTVSTADINLQGNGQNIVTGTVTTTTTNNTNFGTVLATTASSKTFTIQNTGSSILNISSITITGTNASEFVVSGAPASVAAASSATFTLTFTPAVNGIRNATVHVNSNDCDEANYNFAVSGTGGNPLPLKFLGVQVIKKGTSAVLSWQVAEEDMLRYDIEKSADGISFTRIATQPATGAGNYTQTDEQLYSGNNFYRIKAVERNGTITYSAVVKLNVRDGLATIAVYPNPVTDELQLKLSGMSGQEARVTITDASGRMIRNVLVSGKLTVIDMRTLATGVYMIRYADAVQEQLFKITKQ